MLADHVLADNCPSMSYFDSVMTFGHLVVFIAFSIMLCNTVKHRIYSAATMPLLVLLSVLMHKG